MQPQMTSFAVWVTFMNHEFVCLSIFFLTIRAAALFALFCSRGRRFGRVQERIAAFGAEKMQLVVVPLSQDFIVQGDEARFDDWGLAVMAVMGKFLFLRG